MPDVHSLIRATKSGVYRGFSENKIHYGFLSRVRRARVVVLETDLLRSSLPAPQWQALLEATRSVPVFFNAIERDVSPEVAQIMGQATIFDRVLASTSDNLPASNGLASIIHCTHGANLQEVIDDDLSTDETTPGAEINPNDTGPKNHWDSRAATYGHLGRTVCYLDAPRYINKLMHSVQVAELGGALGRAQRATQDPTGKIELLDYGCGIGRLSHFASTFGRYNGIDFAPSMINVARQTNPDANFCTIEEADTGKLSPCDTVMAVTVVQHNDKENRKKIFSRISRLTGKRLRLILLEDLISADRKNAENMHQLTIDDLMDDIHAEIGGTITLESFRLLSYKPVDLVRRTGLLELEIRRQ